MGHFQIGKHGPGPFNLGPWAIPKWKTWTWAIHLAPWVISKVENMDLGHLISAHGSFLKWKTWTWAINLSPWVISKAENMDLGYLHGDGFGPGPFNISPWVISQVENMDLGH